MLLAVDVDYRADGSALAAGVLFADWASPVIQGTVIRSIRKVAPYRPGRFFERELPCILAVLPDVPGRPAAILIDGYVVLGATGRDGLGAHLFKALNGDIAVVGVAKTKFAGTPTTAEVRRGGSRRPLYVTSIGIDADEARQCVQRMHGEHRVPTVLAAVDRACRVAPQASRAGEI
jgi:deoxyribonuclease V